MHWIWQVALGITVATLKFISPHHGFWGAMKYHEYGNISVRENIVTTAIYLICAILIGSGFYRMLSTHKASAITEISSN
jgi:hypothetical protein